jgi:hypothetical protein
MGGGETPCHLHIPPLPPFQTSTVYRTMSLRPTFVVVAALLTLTFVLLLRPFAPNWNLSSSSSSSSIGIPSFCGVYECGQTLRSWIEEEETRYAEALEGREELIKAWGPTEDKVDS